MYDNGQLLYEADPAPFLPVFNQFGNLVCVKDKTHVWIFGDSPMAGVNPSTTVATGGYCKDTAHVIVGDKFVLGADARTFVGLSALNSGGYARDKSQVYFDGFPLHGADTNSFRIINPPTKYKTSSVDAEDRFHRYENGNII